MTIDEALAKAGTKYKKDILTAPLLALADILPYFNLRSGVQGKIVSGALEAKAEFIPYKKAKNPVDDIKLTPREWETFFGDLLVEFDPHEVLGTLYTEKTAKRPDQMEIARRVAIRVMEQAGERLHDNLFIATRNAAGTSTKDLFNGFSTLFDAAIVDGSVSDAKGNYVDTTAETIDENNVGDVLRGLWQKNLSVHLTKRKVLLYCSPEIVNMYMQWFQMEYGHAPWNAGYQQNQLLFANGKCTFVPLTNMADQDYMFFSVKENMLIGVDQESDTETLEIRRPDNPKLVQMWAKTYFGTGFDTVHPAFLCGVKYKTV